jgi:hypothetical protein
MGGVIKGVMVVTTRQFQVELLWILCAGREADDDSSTTMTVIIFRHGRGSNTELLSASPLAVLVSGGFPWSTTSTRPPEVPCALLT